MKLSRTQKKKHIGSLLAEERKRYNIIVIVGALVLGAAFALFSASARFLYLSLIHI